MGVWPGMFLVFRVSLLELFPLLSRKDGRVFHGLVECGIYDRVIGGLHSQLCPPAKGISFVLVKPLKITFEDGKKFTEYK